MTAPSCKRRFRNCNKFGLCVNIGQSGYVLAEDVKTFQSIFLYVVKGNGKIGKMFKTDYLDLNLELKIVLQILIFQLLNQKSFY